MTQQPEVRPIAQSEIHLSPVTGSKPVKRTTAAKSFKPANSTAVGRALAAIARVTPATDRFRLDSTSLKFRAEGVQPTEIPPQATTKNDPDGQDRQEENLKLLQHVGRVLSQNGTRAIQLLTRLVNHLQHFPFIFPTQLVAPLNTVIPAPSKGSPMEAPTPLRDLHWTPLEGTFMECEVDTL